MQAALESSYSLQTQGKSGVGEEHGASPWENEPENVFLISL